MINSKTYSFFSNIIHLKSFFLDNENAERCQINCSMISLDPYYEDMDASEKYEIEELKIIFSSTTYTFILEKQCGDYSYKNVYVTINCEGKYLQGNLFSWKP